MASALDIFDYCQTLAISLCLVVTVPLACFVYLKLLCCRPFSENYTFKLIVVNGVTEIMNCVIYLFVFQLTSYPFMRNFYLFIQKSGIVAPLVVFNVLFAGLSLQTSLFVALNRIKRIIFVGKRHDSDSTFFLVAVSISFLLSLPSALDFTFTSRHEYIEYEVGYSLAFFPMIIVLDDTLLTVTNVIRMTVSGATLLANIFLFTVLTREREYISISGRKRFDGERGLIITSIISFCFYMLYFINNMISRYLKIIICGYVQWFFLGLNAITPLWCLILFTPSVRRLVVKKRKHVLATTINNLTFTLMKPVT